MEDIEGKSYFKPSQEFCVTESEPSEIRKKENPKKKEELYYISPLPKLIEQQFEPFQRTIAKNYLLSHVLSKIENNDCFKHGYLTFYVPAIMVTAEQLAMYTSEKQLQTYKLFVLLIKRANLIMKKSKQLTEEEMVDYLTIAINYRKDTQKVKNTLKNFLQKYELRMKGVMPVYYLYFEMIVNKEELLPTNATIKDAKEVVQKVEQ